MNVYLNSITGIDDAIVSLYMSNKTWTRELEQHIRTTVALSTYHYGKLDDNLPNEVAAEYDKYLDKVFKYCPEHITIGRFIDFSITVDGLHRAGQDDWDAHAQRYNNRIIRMSTRTRMHTDASVSSYYEGKILPTDMAMAMLGITTPDSFTSPDGVLWVKTTNGYIREDMKDDKDVRRGLYMLALPSIFIFKVNLTEWAHVYKCRNKDGHANPEVKELCETICDKIMEFQPRFTRDLFNKIQN